MFDHYSAYCVKILFSENFLSDLSVVEDKEIAPSLAGFVFSKDGMSFDDATFADISHRNFVVDDEDDDGNDGNFDFAFGSGNDGTGDGGPQPVEDFFVGTDAVNDDFGADHFDGDDDNQSNADQAMGATGPAAEGEAGRPGPFVPFDPRKMPNDRDLILAMADGEGGALDYFDQNALKNWAGPEHWKLRKVIRRRKCFWLQR